MDPVICAFCTSGVAVAKKREKKFTPEEQALQSEAAEQEVLTPEEYQVIRAGHIWGHDDTGHDLTLEQALFVRSYMIDRNGIAALRRLNYTHPTLELKKKAERFLSNAEVQGAIEVFGKRMMAKLEITAERIQQRLAAVAFFDPREVMEFDHNGVRMLHSRLWPDHAMSAVQSIEMGQFGPKLKLYDSMKATEMLAKQLQLMPDETSEAAAAAARAAGEAIVEKLFEHFDRTVPDDPGPPSLPPPIDAQGTRH